MSAQSKLWYVVLKDLHKGVEVLCIFNENLFCLFSRRNRNTDQ